MAGWSIRAREWDDPAGADLRRQQRAEIDAHYHGVNHEPGTPPSQADIDVFLVAVDDTGTHVACGALRRLDRESAEVKRMFVIPAARGTGVAQAVLRALEAAALDRGWTTLRLETGVDMPTARRFYQREGYERIDNYGHYVGAPLSVCYQRRLYAGAAKPRPERAA